MKTSMERLHEVDLDIACMIGRASVLIEDLANGNCTDGRRESAKQWGEQYQRGMTWWFDSSILTPDEQDLKMADDDAERAKGE